jgi:hypothetical protein
MYSTKTSNLFFGLYGCYGFYRGYSIYENKVNQDNKKYNEKINERDNLIKKYKLENDKLKNEINQLPNNRGYEKSDKEYNIRENERKIDFEMKSSISTLYSPSVFYYTEACIAGVIAGVVYYTPISILLVPFELIRLERKLRGIEVTDDFF